MSFLQLSSISLAYGDRDVLEGVTLRIDSKDRIALTGANGSGKSSLLKIAAALVSADSGETFLSPHARVTYLPQTGLEHSGVSLRDEAEKAYAYVHVMLEEKAAVEDRLASSKEGDPEVEDLLHHQHRLEEAIAHSGYYQREQKIHEVLSGLGFSKDDFSKDSGTFSGGWQMRIALARALLTTPDILLLDEPTNYLDLEARDWLQAFLSGFDGGIVLVSHDRYFLDSCVNKVAELFLGKLTLYTGNYSAYLKQRSHELEQLHKDYQEQQEEIARLESFIQRFRYNSSKAALVQSRIKQLEKIEPIQIPENMKQVRFSFPQPPHSGRQVIRFYEGKKSYGNHLVFSDLQLEIQRGEKLALVGKNGAGKSTLMRILAGMDTAFEGELKLGSGVRIGFFDQDLESSFTTERSIYDEIEASSPTALIPSLRGLLGAFLFRGDDIYKPLAVLSGGEKSRLALLKLLLNPVNLLILDEPTNHLDLQTKDVLLNVLKEYEGTLIFVSHDRYFIDQLATRVFEIENGRGRNFPGDYAYYRSLKERESPATAELSRQEDTAVPPEGGISDSRLQRKQLKDLQAASRRLSREEEALLEEIEDLERQISLDQDNLASPRVYSDPEAARKVQANINRLRTRIEEAQEKWETLAHQLSETEAAIEKLINPVYQ
ncbi:ABC transporter ATP-binding protein [Marispirochaeta aestuarii]|uniref:ABC transporter ATP-binding protein n=1 Tax=Marispirochaeta aestuarii TaxID=1963862 RepID=A0A1Y1RVA2_9SPIO|nr:ABC-F family ATP-binding cassette domain-containing protein [Marispirochaeta aestuarii]ORC33908.1 ABC transporter ATP-binding protein [Marispirochaeta aestuarii]